MNETKHGLWANVLSRCDINVWNNNYLRSTTIETHFAVEGGRICLVGICIFFSLNIQQFDCLVVISAYWLRSRFLLKKKSNAYWRIVSNFVKKNSLIPFYCTIRVHFDILRMKRIVICDWNPTFTACRRIVVNSRFAFVKANVSEAFYVGPPVASVLLSSLTIWFAVSASSVWFANVWSCPHTNEY